MYRSLLLTLSLILMVLSPVTPSTLSDTPAYTKDGDLVPPANYREWIYLTSGIDMSYDAQPPEAPPPAHSNFYNVFVNPGSYRVFLETGKWPDKTIMVLEIRAAENPVSINTRGHTQSAQIVGMEIHVKDHRVWSFYDVNGKDSPGKLITRPADCYTCHEAHGAVDTTFTQFYPTLFPLAKQKHTLSDQYLKETSAPSKP